MEPGGPRLPTRACLLPAPGPPVSGRGQAAGRPRAASGLVLSGPCRPLYAAGSAVGIRGWGLSTAEVPAESARREGAGGGALGWAGRSRRGGSWSCCSRWDLRVGMGRASVHPSSSFLLPQVFRVASPIWFPLATWGRESGHQTQSWAPVLDFGVPRVCPGVGN